MEASIENLTSQDDHLGPPVLYHVFLSGSQIKSCDDVILTAMMARNFHKINDGCLFFFKENHCILVATETVA